MPLMQGRSKKALSDNIATEMDAGKPKKQSIAIAYSIQRKNKKKMALGGAVETLTHSAPEYDENPGTPENKADDRRLSEDEFMADHFADGGIVESIMRKRKMMAHGGTTEEGPTLGSMIGYPGSPTTVKKSQGGRIQQSDEAAEGMVDSVMRKRKAKMMAEGGAVDLEENSEETPASLSPYDDDNSEAALKEQYDDSQLSSQPEDSNETSDDIDKDDHDLISQVRKKMKGRRE